MDFNAIGDFITNYGLTGVLVAYFLYKDWRTTDKIIGVLEKIQVVLGKLETHHAMEGNPGE